MLQLVYAFQRIMEGDDAARTCVALNIIQHIISGEQATVVTCDDIPHYHLHAYMSQHLVLRRSNPSVRRTEEAGVQYLVSLLDIGQIGPRKMSHAGDVVISVVAYLMSALPDFLEQMRVFDGILAYHKEGGLSIEAVQGIQYKRCCLRDRAVIKSQVHRLLMLVHPPQSMWKHPTQEYCGLLY